MVVFFPFLKSDSLGGRKLCFSIVIARKAKTVFFFLRHFNFVDNKQNFVKSLMKWNVCETTVLLSENLQSIGKKFKPATEKQTGT